MVDMHTHIIPCVDDGSNSIEASISMIKQEIACGVDTIVCTPHHIIHRYEKNVDEIKEQFNLLKEEVEKQNLPVKLILGQEICYSSRDNIIEKLKKKELLTLGESNYVLLEFSFVREPDDIFELMYNFDCNGYKVIIAHVERYEWMTFDMVEALSKQGVYIQVNANSVLNIGEGKGLKRFCKKLLRHNLVDVIASDVHSFREPLLNEAKEKVKKDDLFNGLGIFVK